MNANQYAAALGLEGRYPLTSTMQGPESGLIADSVERDHGECAYYPLLWLMDSAAIGDAQRMLIWHAYTWLWFVAGAGALWLIARRLSLSRLLSGAAVLLLVFTPRMLTEVPEMFGAETLLMARCENEQVFDDTVRLINDFKHYFEEHHQTVYENPSPGNKAGGITTLEDKALGCTQKSGNAEVRAVLPYAALWSQPGLNLLNAPGNDLVATTAVAAAGAQIVLFSTGRGTPFGGPVPTLKIASNTALAQKKPGWIDFDAGRLLEGDATLDAMADELMELVLQTADGRKARNEENGYQGIAIFKTGVTL